MGFSTTLANNSNQLSLGRTGADYVDIAPEMQKGFFMGGVDSSGSTRYATADCLNFVTKTIKAEAAANLSLARKVLASVFTNIFKGYCLSGSTSSYVSTADVTDYTKPVTSAFTPGNVPAADGVKGISSTDGLGIYSGGYGGSLYSAAYKITFSNNTTATQSSANLITARMNAGPVSYLNEKGYFAGGETGSYISGAEKIPFATLTSANQSSANLSNSRSAPAGFSGRGTYGYFLGGHAGSYSSLCDRLQYSNDTTAAYTSGNLPTSRTQMGSVAASDSGYTGGGLEGSGTTATVVGFPFAAQVSSTLSAVLTISRGRLAAHGY